MRTLTMDSYIILPKKTQPIKHHGTTAKTTTKTKTNYLDVQ